MASAKTVHRIAIHLDTRISLEAVLLNRHEKIPRARRQEWLRGLLMQGFRLDCQALRDASLETNTDQENRPLGFSLGVQRIPVRPVDGESTVVEMTPLQTSTSDKPFAALGKVIGQVAG
jgi:hypothetical protein